MLRRNLYFRWYLRKCILIPENVGEIPIHPVAGQWADRFPVSDHYQQLRHFARCSLSPSKLLLFFFTARRTGVKPGKLKSIFCQPRINFNPSPCNILAPNGRKRPDCRKWSPFAAGFMGRGAGAAGSTARVAGLSQCGIGIYGRGTGVIATQFRGQCNAVHSAAPLCSAPRHRKLARPCHVVIPCLCVHEPLSSRH